MNPVTCLLEVNEVGKTFEGYALVKESKDALASNGSAYFDITLSKQHKTVLGKLWGNQFGGYTVTALKELFKAGAIVKVKGRISEYRGNLQIGIESFRSAQEGEVDINEFIASAPESTESMVAEFEGYINSIQTPILQEIVKAIYEENKQAFVIHPAGKSLHHAFYSGLLYHTVSMLRIGEHISKQYPQVNRDLLMAGISLHDMGKIVEIGYEGFVPNYTTIGSFLGHITIINMLIDRKIQEFAKEKFKYMRKDYDMAIQLMHLVSAHHGRHEYGSPVLPSLLEAELIHHIDMIDSRINMITGGLADKAEGEFHKIYPVGNFYKPIES